MLLFFSMFICNNSKDYSERVSYEDVENEDLRIVNGYDSPQRPWIALFVFHEKMKEWDICGGSLLNKRYCNLNPSFRKPFMLFPIFLVAYI